MRFLAIAKRESIGMMRDRRSLFMVVFFPLMLLIIYGYGVTFDIKHVPMAVWDQARNPKSRELIDNFTSSGYFELREYVSSRHRLDGLLINDEIVLGLIIPPDFAENLETLEGSKIQILVNGSDANTANVSMGYQAAVFSSYVEDNLDFPELIKVPSVQARARVWYNPELKSANFIVPGIIVIIMMLLGALLTSNAIVREKETGTIEQIVASPVKRWEYIFGKITPYIFISLFDVCLVVAAGYFVFGVPIRGNLLYLGLFSVLFLANALGIGLLVSAMSESVVSSQLLAFLISLLPSILLSGFIFPISSMPTLIKGITYLVPARYFLTILRGIFLKGVGPEVLWPQAIFLVANAALFLWLASVKFKKRLD
jgi:ABC-2 type transport system permease protein